MFLKSLQIQGFKSFPDKVKLNFEQGITCTVGPNGSGKSNISDAVRWVLGEQSPSALRIKSMEDVVFAGTDTRKPAGFAEVILTIDNSGHWLSSDADEVAICRRYYRSGNSEYKINGKNVRLLDINELFMDTGIGRDGYSMIGQGKIADIVDAKAHDRRVIFEEAAGISKYRHQKETTERNLARTQDNLNLLEVTVASYEERVGPLEKESEKAKKYLELHEQYQKAEIGLWLHILNTSTEKQRDQSYKITLLESQSEELDEQVTQLEDEADELTAKQNTLSAEKDEHLRRASEKEEQAAKLEGEAAVVENDASHVRADISRLENELRQSAQDHEQLSASADEKRRQIDSHTAEIEALEQTLAECRGKIEALRSDEEGRNQQLDDLYAERDRLTVRLNELQLTAAKAASQIEEISSRSAAILTSTAEKKSSIERLEKDGADTADTLNIIKGKIEAAYNTVSGYKLRLDKQRAHAEETRKNVDSLRLDAADKNRRAQMLDDLERNMGGYDHSVKAVIQRAESGGLRGIHGPVSRIIDVDADYAVAIETALGAAIKNIIVETQQDGKRAVEFLKQTRGGRATFLPIDVIEPRSLNERGLDGCEGFIDIASRLVRCDDKYRNIIENLLGRVCIAEDMDSAISIARRFGNRFKIVTLDGQVINAGGSMTGGSQDKNVGLLTRRAELEALRNQAKELSEKAAQAAAEYSQIVRKAGEDEAKLVSAQSELTRLGEDRVRFEAQVRSLAEQLELARGELARLEQESGGASERIAALDAERENAERQAKEINAQLDEMTSRISEDAGSIDRLSGERDELLAALSENGMKQLSLTKEREALEQQLAEIMQRLGSSGERDALTERQIAESKSSISGLEEQSAKLRESASALRAEAAQIRTDTGSFETRRAELEAQAKEKRKEARAVGEQRESLIIEKGKLEERYEQTRREQDSIVLKLMDEYGLTRREAAAQYEAADNEEASKRIVNSLRNKIRALGSVNVGAIEEYKDVLEKYTLYRTQIDDVLKSKAEMESLIAELTKTMQTMFLEAFAKINQNFSEIFPELFGGGTAKMTLVDAEDCLNCGIDINIQQPSKTRGSNVSMSGGEKAIVAVAIYFAIMKVKPSPFCFLDEIDSALDEHNVVNIAQYIKRFTATTQYIVITHRRGMMEAAGMLYGVTKQKKDGISRLIEMKLEEVEATMGDLEA